VAFPEYLTAMVRRAPPAIAAVVARSTPVISFGNPLRAPVATLGINPSVAEFCDGGVLMADHQRRLATLDSLGAKNCEQLTEQQVAEVIGDCLGYFSRRPYMRWFGPLDELLQGSLAVSFMDGTACHLDLVQWATDPVWGLIADAQILSS
jgi:hypothetical protein